MGNNGTFLISIVVGAVAGYWVYTDAKKRPMNAVGWGILTFLFCIVGLPLYLILRKPEGVAPGTPGVPPQPMPLPPTYMPPQQQYAPPPPPPQSYAPPPPTPQAGPPAAAPGHGKFCPNCGAPHEGTVKFCANCGSAL